MTIGDTTMCSENSSTTVSGIDYLAQGLYSKALAEFRIIVAAFMTNEHSEADEYNEDIIVELIPCEVRGSKLPQQDNPVETEALFTFYNRAIRMVGLEIGDNEFLLPNKLQISIVTLYNMALAFHLMAFEAEATGTFVEHRRRLTKSLRLYQLTLHEVEARGNLSSALENFLAMIILNNMGNISGLLSDDDQVINCLEALKFRFVAQRYSAFCYGIYEDVNAFQRSLARTSLFDSNAPAA